MNTNVELNDERWAHEKIRLMPAFRQAALMKAMIENNEQFAREVLADIWSREAIKRTHARSSQNMPQSEPTGIIK